MHLSSSPSAASSPRASRARARLRPLAALATAGLLAAACGGLAEDPDAPRVLATLNGELTNANAVAVPSDGAFRVAVIFRVAGEREFARSLDLAVEPVFPSRFKLALAGAPPAEAKMRGEQLEELDLGAGSGPQDPDNANVTPPPNLPPPSAGPNPTPDPARAARAGRAAIRSGDVALRDHAPALPPDLRIAVGSVVAYVDQNGNGKLDLVGESATQYVDRVLGVNEELVLVWLEGTLDESLRDPSGVMPHAGYNFLRLGRTCTVGVGEDPGGPIRTSEPVEIDGGVIPDGGTLASDAAVPVEMPTPVEDGCTGSDAPGWLTTDTPFTLPLANDPALASLMCDNGGPEDQTDGDGLCGFDPASLNDPNPPQPASYPPAGSSDVRCMFEGRRYEYYACTTVDRGLCRGQRTTCESACVTKPPVTPAGWPCAVGAAP